MPVKYTTVPRVLPHTLLLSLLTYSSMHTPVMAEEQPSLAFLEYLGSEERKVDEKWSSPVDMDIERYLAEHTQTTTAPTEKPSLNSPSLNSPPLNSEDTAHE